MWNNQSPGITVKTLYVPLPKGSSSIPIPDFSQIRPIATLPVPNLSPSGELQLASTLSQNYRPKYNLYQQNVQPLQDVRPKTNQQQYKIVQQSNIAQIPNIQTIYQGSNFNQQQLNSAHLQQAAIQHLQGLQQFYHPEVLSNLANPQNIFYLKNASVIHIPTNGLNNGNTYAQNTHASGTDGRLAQLQSSTNYGQQAYTPENMYPRQPSSNAVYTQYQSAPNSVQSYQQKNNVHQENYPVRNNEAKYSAQSSRYFQQFAADKVTTQQPYTSSTAENTMHSPNQQISYGVQNVHNSQNMDPSIRNSNPFQGFISQSSHQQQQPVNTYAIVHQRVPANDVSSQGSLQAEQNYNGNSGQTHGENTPTSYANNDQSDYTKTANSQEQDLHHNQVSPQNQLNSQNSLKNSQYQEKQLNPVNGNTQQYQGHPVLSHIQVMMSQYRQNQKDSSEAHYLNHQQSASGIRENVNQDISNNQAQNAVSQSPYPDQVSETYYPDNKQVFVSPPPDYSSQAQQLPTPRELGYVRYSSPTETGSQGSLSVQNSQISQSNRNYGYQESPQYSNAYTQ